jgi:hypothetical protein
MRTRTILEALAVVTVLVLILVLAPVLRGPERTPAPASWPAQGWRSSTPEMATETATFTGRLVQP